MNRFLVGGLPRSLRNPVEERDIAYGVQHSWGSLNVSHVALEALGLSPAEGVEIQEGGVIPRPGEHFDMMPSVHVVLVGPGEMDDDTFYNSGPLTLTQVDLSRAAVGIVIGSENSVDSIANSRRQLAYSEGEDDTTPEDDEGLRLEVMSKIVHEVTGIVAATIPGAVDTVLSLENDRTVRRAMKTPSVVGFSIGALILALGKDQPRMSRNKLLASAAASTGLALTNWFQGAYGEHMTNEAVLDRHYANPQTSAALKIFSGCAGFVARDIHVTLCDGIN